MEEKPRVVKILFPGGGPKEDSVRPLEEKPSPKKKIKPLFASTQVSNKVGPQALTLPGIKIRKRLEVAAEVLRDKNPDVSALALEMARRALLLLDLELATPSQMAERGLSEQQTFADLVSRMLRVSASPKIDSVNRGLKEIGVLLSTTELGQLFSEPSGWHALFGRSPRRDEVKSKLRAKVDEVSDRSKSMRERVSELSDLRIETEKLEQELEACATAIESELVVARVLIEHLREDLAEILQRRADSLRLSRLTLKQSNLQLGMVKGHLTHLTETTHLALVNMIPAWCGNCAAFLSSSETSALGPLNAARDEIMKILTGENR